MTDTSKKQIYFIDTSALITIFRFYPEELKEPIWAKLKDMFETGQLISHRLVYEEITIGSKNPDLLSVKVIPLREYFLTQQYSQALIVSEIVFRFPQLIDATREKEQADPWLISIAVERQQGSEDKEDVFLVSEESEQKKGKIPDACKHFNIEHINLDKFFKKIRISFSMKE